MSSLSGPAGLPVTGGPSKANAFDTNGNFYLGSGGTPPGSSLTTGARDFLVGSRAGGNITDWSDVVAMGLDVGLSLTSPSGRTNQNSPVLIGRLAGKTSIEGGNVGVGYNALGGSALTSGNAAYSETAVGENALGMVSGSQKDTAFGSSALAIYQRGGQMLGLGRSPGQWITEGSYDIFIGHASAFFSVAGNNNIMVGNGAGAPTAGNPPRITASVTSGVMTVTVKNGSDANLAVGQTVVSTTATGFATNYTIQSLGTGTGGTGTYNVLPNNQDAVSQTMQAGAATSDNIVIGNSSYSQGLSDASNIIIGNSVTPVSASNITAIGKGQTAAYISGNLSYGTTPATVNNAAGQTWTAAQVRGGQITRSGAVGVSDTTPTAAAIVAAIPGCEVGSTIEFDVINNNTGTLTILAGSGVTLTGTTTIATVFTRKYRARVTNATASSEAVTLYGVMTAAN